jgi:hypothetical protein
MLFSQIVIACTFTGSQWASAYFCERILNAKRTDTLSDLEGGDHS